MSTSLTARARREWLWWASAVLVLVATGCEPGDATAEVEDERGRQCLLMCPAGESICEITCDVAPSVPEDCLERGGEPGYWAETDARDPFPVLLCDACLIGGWPEYPFEECARLVCDEPKDCGYGETLCVDGWCRAPPPE